MAPAARFGSTVSSHQRSVNRPWVDDAVGHASGDLEHALVEGAEQDRHVDRAEHRGHDGCVERVELAVVLDRLHVRRRQVGTHRPDHVGHSSQRAIGRRGEPVLVHPAGSRTEPEEHPARCQLVDMAHGRGVHERRSGEGVGDARADLCRGRRRGHLGQGDVGVAVGELARAERLRAGDLGSAGDLGARPRHGPAVLRDLVHDGPPVSLRLSQLSTLASGDEPDPAHGRCIVRCGRRAACRSRPCGSCRTSAKPRPRSRRAAPGRSRRPLAVPVRCTAFNSAHASPASTRNDARGSWAIRCSFLPRVCTKITRSTHTNHTGSAMGIPSRRSVVMIPVCEPATNSQISSSERRNDGRAGRSLMTGAALGTARRCRCWARGAARACVRR